jgi:hypothetical protein
MISTKDIKTAEDVRNLSNEEMFYIDKAISNGDDFESEEVASEFAYEWVLRGILT